MMADVNLFGGRGGAAQSDVGRPARVVRVTVYHKPIAVLWTLSRLVKIICKSIWYY